MAPKMNMTKLKRLSKGQRTYQRRMKQTARQEGTIYRSLIVRHALPTKIGEALTSVSSAPAGKVPVGE
jgi:hypothetical protein